MLYGFLLCLYFLNCILLVLLVLLQKTKSSLGFGALGGGAQMLFGGGGGQDLFQKVTWILGACFMIGSLGLALMKSRQSREFRYIKTETAQAASRDTQHNNA
ncbi:MAG TPA: preprotein translocase subunit SecG [Candidatus Bathyarchaeia archaeon]|nr:preprotein translocase subunit SecG [Candidatus Bathyarchaeia archaeon]